MNNTLIIYDNANTKINNVLNKISEVIVDSKLHQVSDELKNIDNYSNIAVTIAMEDENNFKLYKSLRNYNIDFTNKKLIIICTDCLMIIWDLIQRNRILSIKRENYLCLI